MDFILFVIVVVTHVWGVPVGCGFTCVAMDDGFWGLLDVHMFELARKAWISSAGLAELHRGSTG